MANPYMNFGHTHDVYSEDETVIGYWIDGKPLYRKVINFTIGTSDTRVSAGLTNADKVVDMRGVFKLTDTEYRPICWAYATGATTNAAWYIGVAYLGSTDQIQLYSGNQNYGKSGWIIIEYTKTTD